MQLLQPFDPAAHDPTQGVAQLPVGKMPVMIVASEVKPTNAGDGGLLLLTLQILDGPNKGATGAYRLNLYHSNPKTVEIAHRQLSALVHAIGLGNAKVTDSSQLHNIPFIVDVEPQKDDPKYTEVKKVYDINGNEPKRGQVPVAGTPVPISAPQSQPQQAPASTPAAAWAQPAPSASTTAAAPSWGASPTSPAANPATVAPATGAWSPQTGAVPSWGPAR